MPEDVVHLAAGDAAASIALRGAEPVRWTVGGRELLWDRDPAGWAYSAPILFPVVGASRDGEVRVDGVPYPMAQHGFARQSPFELVDAGEASATLRLRADEGTRELYPYRFRLEVTVTLTPQGLELAFEVGNEGERPMPYGLGFHPAFRWPFDAPGKAGHRVVFETPERGEAPEVGVGGLLTRRMRPLPLEGRTLPLSPEIFSEALVFLGARSRSFAFESPTGAAIAMAVERFPHLAVWSRPEARFLSLEAWTAHADWEDATGDLPSRPSMITLAPGETARHAVRLAFRPAPGQGG